MLPSAHSRLVQLARAFRGIVLIVASLGVLPALAAPAPPRLILPVAVSVATSSIFLSDLLPANAPAELRKTAELVLVAAAPDPGTISRFDGAVIQSQIKRLDPHLALTVPAQILVRRQARLLSVEDVLPALRQALPAPQAASLSAAQVRVPAGIAVLPGALHFRVLAVMPAPQHGQTLFDLQAVEQPSLQPFWVRVHQPLRRQYLAAAKPLAAGTVLTSADMVERIAPAGLNLETASSDQVVGRALLRSLDTGQPLFFALTAPVMLVSPRRPALLSVRTAAYSFSMRVLPLQPAAAGQIINARNLASHALIRVRVVGPDAVAPVSGGTNALGLFH